MGIMANGDPHAKNWLSWRFLTLATRRFIPQKRRGQAVAAALLAASAGGCTETGHKDSVVANNAAEIAASISFPENPQIEIIRDRFSADISAFETTHDMPVVITDFAFLGDSYDPSTGVFSNDDIARQRLQAYFMQQTGGRLENEVLENFILFLMTPHQIAKMTPIEVVRPDGKKQAVMLIMDNPGQTPDPSYELNLNTGYLRVPLPHMTSENYERYVLYHEVAHGLFDYDNYIQTHAHFMALQPVEALRLAHQMETYADIRAMLELAKDGVTNMPLIARDLANARIILDWASKDAGHLSTLSLDTLSEIFLAAETGNQRQMERIINGLVRADNTTPNEARIYQNIGRKILQDGFSALDGRDIDRLSRLISRNEPTLRAYDSSQARGFNWGDFSDPDDFSQRLITFSDRISDLMSLRFLPEYYPRLEAARREAKLEFTPFAGPPSGVGLDGAPRYQAQ